MIAHRLGALKRFRRPAHGDATSHACANRKRTSVLLRHADRVGRRQRIRNGAGIITKSCGAVAERRQVAPCDPVAGWSCVVRDTAGLTSVAWTLTPVVSDASGGVRLADRLIGSSREGRLR